MGFWVTFWGVVLLAGLLGFAGLSLVVTFGGFREIRAMFEGIEAQHGESGNEE